MENVEFHIPVDLIVFRISGLVGLQNFHWILSCMRAWDWHLVKSTKPFMHPNVGGVDS
jgi:hypothetical protein